MFKYIWWGGASIANWKEIIISIPYDRNYYFCEAYDWWIEIILADIKVKYLPSNLFEYLVQYKNMTSNIFKIYFFNIKIFNKLFIKSLIITTTFIVCYLRSSISLIVKLINVLQLSVFIRNFKK